MRITAEARIHRTIFVFRPTKTKTPTATSCHPRRILILRHVPPSRYLKIAQLLPAALPPRLRLPLVKVSNLCRHRLHHALLRATPPPTAPNRSSQETVPHFKPRALLRPLHCSRSISFTSLQQKATKLTPSPSSTHPFLSPPQHSCTSALIEVPNPANTAPTPPQLPPEFKRMRPTPSDPFSSKTQNPKRVFLTRGMVGCRPLHHPPQPLFQSLIGPLGYSLPIKREGFRQSLQGPPPHLQSDFCHLLGRGSSPDPLGRSGSRSPPPRPPCTCQSARVPGVGGECHLEAGQGAGGRDVVGGRLLQHRPVEGSWRSF